MSATLSPRGSLVPLLVEAVVALRRLYQLAIFTFALPTIVAQSLWLTRFHWCQMAAAVVPGSPRSRRWGPVRVIAAVGVHAIPSAWHHWHERSAAVVVDKVDIGRIGGEQRVFDSKIPVVLPGADRKFKIFFRD
jgi:hypothetical protein